MKQIRKPMQVEAIIPTASMADISFLLIVFFMVTFKVVPEKTEVNVPHSNVREPIEYINDCVWIAIRAEEEDARTILLTFEPPGNSSASANEMASVYKMQEMSLSEFDAAIPGIIYAATYKQETTFVLKAQGDVRYSYIDEVIEIIKKNGIKDVMLLTEQKTVGE